MYNAVKHVIICVKPISLTAVFLNGHPHSVQTIGLSS